MALPTDENESTPNTSRRESLAAAMASLESGDGAVAEPEVPLEAEPVADEPAPAEGAEPAEAAEEPAGRDERGRFKGGAPKDGDEPKPKAEAKPKADAAPAEGEPKPKAADLPPVKAPQAWKPAVRELAAKLPAEFRPLIEEANRRERDAARVIQENAQLRQQVQQAQAAPNPYREAVAPFENSIRQRGGEPRQFVASLLQTEHALSTSQPHQRADLLARLVIQYGQDVLRPDRQDEAGNASSPLDRALVALMSGRAPAPQQMQPQGQPSPQQFRDPRLDALLEQQKQRAQEAEAAAAQEAETLAGSFAESHEFYGDVREQLANVLDVWAKQGKREVSDEEMEQAYEIACRMTPDVAPIFEQRRAAEAAEKARASTRRAKAAATSVRSAPVPAAAVSDGKPISRRESMKRAMEAQESQGRV